VTYKGDNHEQTMEKTGISLDFVLFYCAFNSGNVDPGTAAD
jgi:hypothetical protein